MNTPADPSKQESFEAFANRLMQQLWDIPRRHTFFN